jgi:hypothetical protein
VGEAFSTKGVKAPDRRLLYEFDNSEVIDEAAIDNAVPQLLWACGLMSRPTPSIVHDCSQTGLVTKQD